MGSEAQNLWDWIEVNLLGDEDQEMWTNTVAYGMTVDEDHMDEMVDEVFGGYNYWIRFTNGTTQYKLKALPLQNKHDRAKHAYGTYRGHENIVNIVAWPAAGGANVFNLHINVRRLSTALKYRAKHTVDQGGWSTVKH